MQFNIPTYRKADILRPQLQFLPKSSLRYVIFQVCQKIKMCRFLKLLCKIMKILCVFQLFITQFFALDFTFSL